MCLLLNIPVQHAVSFSCADSLLLCRCFILKNVTGSLILVVSLSNWTHLNKTIALLPQFASPSVGEATAQDNSETMSDKTEVNLTGVKQSQGVWLVKVPKYLSRQWEKATEKGEVGKISIGKKQGKSEVHFSLNEELTTLGVVGEKDQSLQVPKDHPFTMHTVGGQTLAVFSQSDTDEISLEGMVVHRAECRPVVNDNYVKLKRLQIKESTKSPRLSQQLERAITTVFKPVANHDFNVLYDKKKKSEGKMVRAERQVVLDMLFSAFEKHQYYNMKDLVDITKQPVTYLKEIMKDIGTYNNKGAHKSTWELRPEYRHYQSAEEEEMQTA